MSNDTLSTQAKKLLVEANWTECAHRAINGEERFAAVFLDEREGKQLIQEKNILKQNGGTIAKTGDGTEVAMTQAQMENLGIRSRNPNLPISRNNQGSHADRINNERELEATHTRS